MSRVIFFFIFSLSALVGSINGRTSCGSTPTTPNWRDQMESSEESQRQMGRIGLECENEGYTGGSGSGSVLAILLEVFGTLIILFFVASGIWCVCGQRQKAINAANSNNFPGQVEGAQVSHGTNVNSYPETKTVQYGDPAYKV